MEVVEQ